jgi:hypothetical protein
MMSANFTPSTFPVDKDKLTNLRITGFRMSIFSLYNCCGSRSLGATTQWLDFWQFHHDVQLEEVLSLFAQQKKGMRAVMPGHVNYLLTKDGILPSGTKPSFNSLSILTVHDIIASNTTNFMSKIFNFPNQLPKYVQVTFSKNPI